VVWVKETNSVYYETACGSGTVAVGMFLAFSQRKDFSGFVRQPSGESILAEVKFDIAKNEFKSSWIGGCVKIIAYGKTFVY